MRMGAGRLRALSRFLKLGMLVGVSVPAVILASWLRDLPDLRALEDLQPVASSVLLDRNGAVLAEYSRQSRDPVPLRELPPLVVKTVLATEDWSFYEHMGLDLQGLARALFFNLRSGRLQQGGSTITQQLTKKVLLTSERTLRRKTLEMILALEIEQTYSKDQILELYLNTIYFGQGAYGIKTAAEQYFSKAPRELDDGECAMLAALIRGPSVYDPVKFPDLALERRNQVLGRMLERGVIDQARHDLAVRRPLGLRMRPAPPAVAQDFVEAVRRELVASLGAETLYSGGLRAQTTLDPQVQSVALAALSSGLARVEKRIAGKKGAPAAGILQGAILVLDVDTGDVLAMVGGRAAEGEAHRFNRALQARRQPGSLFKPFIYTAAIDNGMTGATLVEDVPLELLDARGEVEWTPQNYDEKHHGPTTIRTALVHSRNIVAVRVFNTLGMDLVLDYTHRLGVRSELPRFLSLALGAGEVTLLEMVRAYTPFAAGGIRVEPRTLRLVTNRRGGLVLQNPPRRERVISERTAYLVADLLHDAVARGTGTSAGVKSVWAAGKTGTTNDYSDAWFIGTAPPLVIGVWIGYDERKRMGKETGSQAAAPIFKEILEQLRPRFQFREPARPSGLKELRIDPGTGLEANKRCPSGERELFLPGQAPGPCFH